MLVLALLGLTGKLVLVLFFSLSHLKRAPRLTADDINSLYTSLSPATHARLTILGRSLYKKLQGLNLMETLSYSDNVWHLIGKEGKNEIKEYNKSRLLKL